MNAPARAISLNGCSPRIRLAMHEVGRIDRDGARVIRIDEGRMIARSTARVVRRLGENTFIP